MEPFRRITIAVDRSPADSALWQYASGVIAAAASDACIEIGAVHVLPVEDAHSVATAPGATHREALEDLQAAAARHLRTHARVSCHVLAGSRLDRLLQFAAEWRSDVIVAGQQRDGRGRRSLCRRLAMQAPCSLWMVPSGSPSSISALLTAVDFSPASAQAATVSTLLACRFQLDSCTGVYVESDCVLALDETVRTRVRQEGEAAFQRFLQPLDLHGVPMRRKIVASRSVACGLLRAAADEQADLVVMGARGLSSSSAVLLGSEAEEMLALTDRPVLLIREQGQRLDLLEALLDRDLQTALQ
jgi:nucleotide-binding universal stress UspA family protein